MKRLLLLRGSRGQSMLEFALVVPILLLLVFGLFDLGWAVYTNNTIANAARQGARAGILVSVSDTDIRTAVKAAAPGLGLIDAQIMIMPIGLSSPPYRAPGHPLSVRVNYTYYPSTPIIGQIVRSAGGILLTSNCSMVVE